MKNKVSLLASEINGRMSILEILSDKELKCKLSLKLSNIFFRLSEKKIWYDKELGKICDECLEKDTNGSLIEIYKINNNKEFALDENNDKIKIGFKVIESKREIFRDKLAELDKTDILLDCEPILLSEFEDGIGNNSISFNNLCNLRLSFIIDDKNIIEEKE